MTYAELSEARKEIIHAMQENSWRWIIRRDPNAVFSVNCERDICVPVNSPTMGQTCKACRDVLLMASFKSALRKERSEDPDALKYTNNRYLNTGLSKLYKHATGLRELLEAVSIYYCFSLGY